MMQYMAILVFQLIKLIYYKVYKSKKTALNVQAVNEGFLCPMRKMRSILRVQKTLAERKSHKGAKRRLGFFGA